LLGSTIKQLTQLTAYLPLLAASAGLVVLWLNRAKWSRAVFFAAAYYIVSLFPVLGFFNVYFFRYSFVSDHFQYLASMGPLALAGAGIVTGVSRFSKSQGLPGVGPNSRTSRLQGSGAVTITMPVVTACVAVLCLLCALTWLRTADYRDVITLYKATLAKNPGCWMAHYNLGIALNERGEPDAAIVHYRQAVDLRPAYAEAHYNLARLLVEKGQLDEAITQYDKALEIDPSDADAHNNLGVTLFAKGRVDEAIDQYRKALSAQPDYADAACNLASALLSKNDLDGAINYYSACVSISPNQPEGQYNLASALFRRGRADEAIIHYEKCLQLKPDNADAHANLGSAFLAKGRLREAIAQYNDALRIAHDNVAAQSNLAWLLATAADPSLRNGPEAVALAERAESESSRGENHAIVLRILAAAYAEAGRFVEAKNTAEQALEAAKIQGNSNLAGALRTEISLYELGLPYHKQAR